MRRTKLCRRGIAFLLLALCLVATPGCASWRAARLYQSGTRSLDAGEPGRAIAELEEAAKLAPGASEIQNHLGLAYLASGRRDAARHAFDRAIDLDCDNAAARHNRGLLNLDLSPGSLAERGSESADE